MGLFCASLHFQSTDDQALTASLKRRGISRYRVLAAKNGWTSLYEEQASEQDEERICELATGLSQDLRTAAIAFLVHDSDVACYWLFDDGRLLDQYNSCPDYFDDATGGGPQGPSGGRVDLLVRYCRTGVRPDELAAILAEDNVFAENVVERLADALGIDPARALGDYRDIAGGEGPGGDSDGGDDSGDGGDFDGDLGGGGDVDDGNHIGGWNIVTLQTGLAGRLAKMLGLNQRTTTADPQAAALVQAAAAGDTHEISRLLAEGAAIDAEAPTALSSDPPIAGLGKLFPGGAPQIAMTPLLAAIAHKQRDAAQLLLDSGADPNHLNLHFGTAVHAATGAGEVELLKSIIDRGGDVTARNNQGLTPLEVVAACRATQDRLAQAQAAMQSMGVKFAGLLDKVSDFKLPTEGWDACEQLLRAHGAL